MSKAIFTIFCVAFLLSGCSKTNTVELKKERQGFSTETVAEQNSYDNGKFVVAIDAGHQAKANNGQEPIGFTSDITKAKVSSGTQRVSTGIPEYELTLTLALKLRDELNARGYHVVMIRETNDVNISNKERAEIASESKADILVRIHADWSENKNINGVLTLSPTSENPFVSQLYSDSRRLADDILCETVAATGAKNRGVSEVDNMSGINWSTVPVTILEVGLMSNPDEDKLMQTDEYQNKLVSGMVNGINIFFEQHKWSPDMQETD